MAQITETYIHHSAWMCLKPIMLKNVLNFRITVYHKLLKKLFSDGTVCVVVVVAVVVVVVVWG